MTLARHNWTTQEIIDIYNKPMMDLLFEAATIHRQKHDPNVVQVSTLLSIKTGGCPEDCGYCPQAARYHTDITGNDLMSVSQVKAQALRAKSSGSSRVCMGAAWRNVKDGPEFDHFLWFAIGPRNNVSKSLLYNILQMYLDCDCKHTNQLRQVFALDFR